MAAALIAVLAIGLSSATAKKKKVRNPGTLTLAQQTYHLANLDDRTRLTVECPGGRSPYGGGFLTSPPAAGGEGVFPNSFERLGQQGGFHATVALINLGPAPTVTPRDVTLQVLCGKKIGKNATPHTFGDLQPGEGPRTLIATCPGKRTLIGGGHQQANGISRKGVIVTESHQISAKSWQVVARNLGGFAGTAVSIGYCVSSKKSLITETTNSVTVGPNETQTAMTPPCPAGRQLDWGGFVSPPTGEIRFMGAGFTAGGTWSATGFNSGAAPATLTATGYCLRV